MWTAAVLLREDKQKKIVHGAWELIPSKVL